MKDNTLMRCYSCGGKMVPIDIEKEIRWGDFTIVVKGIKAYQCEECGQQVYTSDEVKMMENLAKALSESDAPKPQHGEYLNLSETAKILRVSNQTVYNMIKDGRIKAQKVGREWRFLASDLYSNTDSLSDQLQMAAKGGKISEQDKAIIEKTLKDNE